MMRRVAFTAFLLAQLTTPFGVVSFTAPVPAARTTTTTNGGGNKNSPLVAAAAAENAEATAAPTKVDPMYVPTEFSEMVNQVSSAMKDAYKEGKKRQLIRILLPRDADNEAIGSFYENEVQVDNKQNVVLVPPDESWQGGIMQLYSSAAPTCTEIMRRYTQDTSNGIPPRIVEDRSVDESGVDGVGLLKIESEGGSIRCFVQPCQESIEYVEGENNADLVAIMNPQWRIVDDALDKASRDDSVFGKLAAFLGGKGDTLKRLDDMSYETVYNLEGYVCRGYRIRLLKLFNSDWTVFCEQPGAGTGADPSFTKLGKVKSRPTYQEVETFLEGAGIGFKYAEEFGK